MVNRRQFFSKFWNAGPGFRASNEDGDARRKELETQVRAQLYPSDFALRANEKSHILTRAHSLINGASSRELFSNEFANRLDRLVQVLVDGFRMASQEVTPFKDPATLRKAGVESVSLFLDRAGPERIDVMLTRLRVNDPAQLETHLRKELASWFELLPDEELMKHDRVSIQDPAIERLRVLCGEEPAS